MPQVSSNGFDAERFAALMARFDIGNSEAEAMNSARALRRMLVEKNVRLVDAVGRADVMKALDAQMQPVREDSEELKAAFVEIARYAEIATEQTEIAHELRRRLAASAPAPRETGWLVNGRLVGFAVLLAVALMIAAAFR